MKMLKAVPSIGDEIHGHTVTEVRKDGAVFGVEGKLPKKEIARLKQPNVFFRPGYRFATIAK